MKKIAILRQRFSDPQVVAISLATIRKKRIDFWKRTKVDATAFIIFGVITGFVTIIYEVIIAGTTPHQWLEVRIIYTFLRCLGVYFLGRITDKLREKIISKRFSKKKSLLFISKWFADGISLSVYQIPIYIISALICGVEIKAIFLASLLYIGDNFIFGWFFGYILDKTRLYFSRGARVC